MTKVDLAEVGDACPRVAIASTTRGAAEYARTDAGRRRDARREGGETQTGFSYAIGRELGELGWEQVADEAVERAVRMLGAVKPPTARCLVLDQFAGMTFLGVLSSALSAEAVLKGRSLFAGNGRARSSARSCSRSSTTAACWTARRACPFDDEGVPSGRTELFTAGRAERVPARHVHGRAMGGGTASTGNAQRGRLPRRARRRHDELLPRGRGTPS